MTADRQDQVLLRCASNRLAATAARLALTPRACSRARLYQPAPFHPTPRLAGATLGWRLPSHPHQFTRRPFARPLKFLSPKKTQAIIKTFRLVDELLN